MEPKSESKTFKCLICSNTWQGDDNSECNACDETWRNRMVSAHRMYNAPPINLLADHFMSDEFQPLVTFIKNERQFNKLVATKNAYQAGFYKS